MKVQVRAVCCTLDAFEISSKYNVMLFAPLLDYTEHSSSMSGGGPEQSEVISAVNTSFISLGAEINTRHSIYLKQGEREHKHSWVDLFTDVL